MSSPSPEPLSAFLRRIAPTSSESYNVECAADGAAALEAERDELKRALDEAQYEADYWHYEAQRAAAQIRE